MPFLLVSNLPPDTTPTDLERIFSRHGRVLSAQIAVNQKTGQIQNFGLVEMPEKDAHWARETLHRSWYKNNCIEVQWSSSAHEQGQRSRPLNRHSLFKNSEIYLVSGF